MPPNRPSPCLREFYEPRFWPLKNEQTVLFRDGYNKLSWLAPERQKEHVYLVREAETTCMLPGKEI
jgi:hypothetical protein